MFTRTRTLLFISILIVAAAAQAEIEITLKNTTIDKFRNRATIDLHYRVVHAHAHPNSASKDGDMHIAGHGDVFVLPAVAEIMNANFEPAAVTRIHEVEGTTTSVRMIGVWRLWCEHGGNSEQVEGAPIPAIVNTNPPHVLEIHPVTDLDGASLLKSLRPVQPTGGVDFVTKDAQDAFQRYENLRSKITPGATTTTITTSMAGYNYVEFRIRLNQDPHEITDPATGNGIFVLAQVESLDGDLLVHNRRMVFVPGSDPANDVMKMKAGGCMHVLGVPRINLALLWWRVQHAGTRPDVLTWNLPYEMVIVGEYPGGCSDE